MTRWSRELAAFVTASLATPVSRPPADNREHLARRRIAAGVTLVCGAAVLAYSLRIRPGDPRFYLATLLLAAVWTIGALSSGSLHIGWAETRAGTHVVRPVVQPLVLGLLLLGIFSAGALVIARVPELRDPVATLLDHAGQGSLPVVVLLVALNCVAEELYFRGALYTAVLDTHPVVVTTAFYTAATAAGGIPLLAFAGLVLGAVTALQRRVTRGVLAPILTHLTWTLGMLFVLPPILDFAR